MSKEFKPGRGNIGVSDQKRAVLRARFITWVLQNGEPTRDGMGSKGRVVAAGMNILHKDMHEAYDEAKKKYEAPNDGLAKELGINRTPKPGSMSDTE